MYFKSLVVYNLTAVAIGHQTLINYMWVEITSNVFTKSNVRILQFYGLIHCNIYLSFLPLLVDILSLGVLYTFPLSLLDNHHTPALLVIFSNL